MQQQPGSYRGGDYDDEMLVLLAEETGAPGENHQPGNNKFILHAISVLMRELVTMVPYPCLGEPIKFQHVQIWIKLDVFN